MAKGQSKVLRQKPPGCPRPRLAGGGCSLNLKLPCRTEKVVWFTGAGTEGAESADSFVQKQRGDGVFKEEIVFQFSWSPTIPASENLLRRYKNGFRII